MASGIKKGIHRTTARLADGAIKTYVYAWKGGPRPDMPTPRRFSNMTGGTC